VSQAEPLSLGCGRGRAALERGRTVRTLALAPLAQYQPAPSQADASPRPGEPLAPAHPCGPVPESAENLGPETLSKTNFP
jgi:hypothetical protein